MPIDRQSFQYLGYNFASLTETRFILEYDDRGTSRILENVKWSLVRLPAVPIF